MGPADVSMARVRTGSTMFRPTIVIWLVLLMLALNVVAFVTRIIEKYRLPMASEDHQKEPSLSYRPVNRRY
jgi:hypothetical protein